ncbi:MAG: transglycosylase SLT domain-containing protein [Actinomycetota bacterium]
MLRLRLSLAVLLSAVVLAGCSDAPEHGVPGAGGTASPAESPDPSAAPTDAQGSKDERAAARLQRLEKRLSEGIDAWLESGDPPRGPQWRELELTGLALQKTYRWLAHNPKMARKVETHLSGNVAYKLRANVKAARTIGALVKPLKKPVKMKTTEPTSPKKLLRYYREAEERFDVPWNILASVNFIESKFGRLNGPSSAGALGPMQFMPATWDHYGRGDPMKPYNAIMAAARYLSASGAPDRMRDALWAYNHSDAYVDAIQIHARVIKQDIHNFYGYYLYQVFVLTEDGYLQLTGPGSDYRY